MASLTLTVASANAQFDRERKACVGTFPKYGSLSDNLTADAGIVAYTIYGFGVEREVVWKMEAGVITRTETLHKRV